MTIYENINALVGYGLTTGLIEAEDTIYTQNRLLELFALDGFENAAQAATIPHTRVEELESILKQLLDYAGEKKLFADDGIVYRDLFDTKIMSICAIQSSAASLCQGLSPCRAARHADRPSKRKSSWPRAKYR